MESSRGSGQKFMAFLMGTIEVLSIFINKGLPLILAKQSRFCYNITIKSHIQIINEIPVPIHLKISNNSILTSINIKVPYYQCSARDWERSGLLEENPQSGCSDICASLKGPL